VRELARLNDGSLKTLHKILSPDTPVYAQLVAQGVRWGWHVLEGPVAWILCALYIAVTVVIGATPLSAIVNALVADDGGDDAYAAHAAALFAANASASTALQQCAAAASPATSLAACSAAASAAAVAAAAEAVAAADFDASARVPWEYVVAAVDAVLYAFLPWWMTVLLRLVQRRPWLHRVSGRTVVIGDVPWVAQARSPTEPGTVASAPALRLSPRSDTDALTPLALMVSLARCVGRSVTRHLPLEALRPLVLDRLRQRVYPCDSTRSDGTPPAPCSPPRATGCGRC
jgi:hypothetical protein